MVDKKQGGNIMKIVISGTNEELAQFLCLAALDEKFKVLVQENALEKKEAIDDPNLAEFFDRISWETFYLWHLIYVKGHSKQTDSSGTYLTVNQLMKNKIEERSASARVGGAKKVSKDLGFEEIMFIKWRRDEKRYYIRQEAVPSLLQFLEIHKNVYMEFLDDNDLRWPK